MSDEFRLNFGGILSLIIRAEVTYFLFNRKFSMKSDSLNRQLKRVCGDTAYDDGKVLY